MNHRRPNPDELTPDDLFRPADGGPTAAYGAPLAEPDAQGASTQYLPPMPAAPQAQPYGGQPGYTAPTQPYQAFPQQQAQPDYGRPAYDQGGYDQGYDQGGYEQYDDYDEDPHRNRPSMRTLAIAVVVGCAVLGIGLGALLGSGNSSASASADKSAGTKHGASAGPGPNDKGAQLAQAQKLSQLLETASSNRSAVINAVADIAACQALPAAQQALTNAAQARGDLVTQLGQLPVSALPSGKQLVADLTTGWQASQQADSHYASWAAESAGPCQKKHHPKAGGEKAAGDNVSGTATQAKREAAALWNTIASANGLPTKTSDRL
ncbi:hypothetical protein DN069_29040 [Streptacidiphilus pinicola]|uniref:Uncharacterized protein n=1 Tax=Streptacidiphilus pinicola TaxID=2219663 RepID=A0A2X0IAZ0_9ACTN|nr:hypothetical protein [Streptacidiphilus pinicola]RAG82132.1 hypothetical protein DN069_29040 [Streptacidiphilus pinicola]